MMKLFYNIGIDFYYFIIWIAGRLNHKKAQQFIKGRKNAYNELQEQLKNFSINRKKVWFHVSSLGEFEQAKPIMSRLKHEYPDIIILLSFFSPSGMNHAKTDGITDIKFYLPKDSRSNAFNVFNIIQPSLVIFVKYDLWHYYIAESKQRGIPLILISAHFRESQIYFKPWSGTFYKNILHNITHIYTQDQSSLKLLKNINVIHTSVAGDTRVDSVMASQNEEKRFPKIEDFIDKNRKIIIIGSAWEDDISLMRKCYEKLSDRYQLIIAPHDIQDDFIKKIATEFSSFKIQKYTDENLSSIQDILIINTIGILKYVYRYSVMSWIGGGFRSAGIHNILEPAAYGNAVFIGPNYKKFPEAAELIRRGGVISSTNISLLIPTFSNESLIAEMGQKCSFYVLSHSGATEKIMNDIINIIGD